MKRIGIVLLVIALVFCACGRAEEEHSQEQGQNVPDTENPAETEVQADVETEIDWLSTLPEASYDGFEFGILAVPEEVCIGIQSFYAEEQTGEIINDTVFERNAYVEKLYDIAISYEGRSGVISQTSNLVKAGDETFAIVSDEAKLHLASSTKGIFWNLHSIDALDLTAPWWYRDAVDSLTIAGKLYEGYSDINTQIKDRVACMFVNMDLIEDNNLDNPYGLVLEGKWTLDVMTDMAHVATKDLNGDGRITQEDIAGTVVGIGTYNQLTNGCDQPLATKDEDGNVVLQYGSEAFINAAQKIAKQVDDPTIRIYLNTDMWGFEHFREGKALLLNNSPCEYKNLREYDSHFGILPVPKYDEAQKEYRSMMNNSSMGLSIPASIKDPERVGTIIEALNAYSYMNLKDAYFETVLKGKMARDEESVQMLDIITTTFIVDYGVMNENTWADIISGWMSTMQSRGPEGLAALYAANQEKFNKLYTKILNAYEKLP